MLTLHHISKSYGATPLFADISITIGAKERVGLIGANGSGKSTLLKILAGLIPPDAGERVLLRQAKLAYLAQEDELAPGRTVEEIVAEPLAREGVPAADLYTRVGVMLGKMGFADRAQRVDDLSGGWRKRLALARELVKQPDVLLLDEPTNHLDLESILWLEKMLPGLPCGFVVVSHDRAFLENVTTRTVELGRAYSGGYFSVDGPYSAFLEKREDYLATLAGYEQSLANKVRREVEWLRRGPKARTTKAQYRIDEAGRLQEELAKVKRMSADRGQVGIDFTGTERKTKRLLVAEKISKSLGGRTLFKDLDIVLSPGLRLGLAGLNGSGKTTLLRVLAGEIEPDDGRVQRAPELQVVIFDQKREQLDPEKTLRQSLSPHGDSVIYRDRPIHVAAWARRFLFTPDQLPLPVGRLSGGEQARVLIAGLMLRPADVLLLDEPTNDLDIQTLEILEESLTDFPGSVVLVSHDRFLLDRVATVILGLDGKGGAQAYADYAQWDADRREREAAEAKREKEKSAPPRQAEKPKPVKLSYKEQREWDAMEDAIHAAEATLAACQAALEDPAVASNAAALAGRMQEHAAAEAEVERLYARWSELEAKLNAGK